MGLWEDSEEGESETHLLQSSVEIKIQRKKFKEHVLYFQWETAAQTNRILMEARGSNAQPEKPKKKKKKKKAVVTDTASAGHKKYPDRRKPGREPPEHYKLNLGEIPFIAGKVSLLTCFTGLNFHLETHV